jgi:hypothetical protein
MSMAPKVILCSALISQSRMLTSAGALSNDTIANDSATHRQANDYASSAWCPIKAAGHIVCCVKPPVW